MEFFLARIYLYSDWIQENTDQKKIRVWTLLTQSGVIPAKVNNILPVVSFHIFVNFMEKETPTKS